MATQWIKNRLERTVPKSEIRYSGRTERQVPEDPEKPKKRDVPVLDDDDEQIVPETSDDDESTGIDTDDDDASEPDTLKPRANADRVELNDDEQVVPRDWCRPAPP